MTPSRKKGDEDGRGRKRSRGKQREQEAAPTPSPSRSIPPGQVTPRLEDVAPDIIKGPALPFPVVCIGASAGGLEAFTQLLESLPTDTGMAYVLVSHLSPSHASHLADILSRSTRMPVQEVAS